MDISREVMGEMLSNSEFGWSTMGNLYMSNSNTTHLFTELDLSLNPTIMGNETNQILN